MKLGMASVAVYDEDADADADADAETAGADDAASVGSNTAGGTEPVGFGSGDVADDTTAEDGATTGGPPGDTHFPFDGAKNGIPCTSLTVTRSFGPGSGYSNAVPAVLRHSPSAIWPGMFMSPTYMGGYPSSAVSSVLVPSPVMDTAAQFM